MKRINSIKWEKPLSNKDKVRNLLPKVALVIMCAGSSSRFDSEDKFITPLNLKVNPKLTIMDMIFIRLKLKIN